MFCFEGNRNCLCQQLWEYCTSTNLSCVLIQTLAVITLTEAPGHQAPVVVVVTLAATTVTGSCEKYQLQTQFKLISWKRSSFWAWVYLYSMWLLINGRL